MTVYMEYTVLVSAVKKWCNIINLLALYVTNLMVYWFMDWVQMNRHAPPLGTPLPPTLLIECIFPVKHIKHRSTIKVFIVEALFINPRHVCQMVAIVVLCVHQCIC